MILTISPILKIDYIFFIFIGKWLDFFVLILYLLIDLNFSNLKIDFIKFLYLYLIIV